MQPRGFTLIEVLVVIGMLAILSTVVLVAVNPLRQFAQARNSEREAHVNTLLNAVGQRIADNRGVFEGPGCDPLPYPAETIASTGFDLRSCLVTDYLSEIPLDPTLGTNDCVDEACTEGGYMATYSIERSPATNRITICAPNHAETAIPNSTEFCLTR